MSLQLSISVEEQANSFYVYNCTGTYDPKTNPGGFNGPNPKITDIITSVITVTPSVNPNTPTIITPNQLDTIVVTPPPPTSYNITASPDFPSGTDDSQGYEVLPYMIGNANNVIPSGKCRIQWTVTGNQTIGTSVTPFTKTTFLDVVFIKTVTCCVDKLQKQVNVSNYKDKKSKAIIELNNLLQSAEYGIECGLLDQADKEIRLMESQCQCVDC